MALYEAPHLKASDRVKLDEARLLLKLRDDPHPWRRALMEHAAGPEASVKLTRQFKRANDLSAMSASHAALAAERSANTENVCC